MNQTSNKNNKENKPCLQVPSNINNHKKTHKMKTQLITLAAIILVSLSLSAKELETPDLVPTPSIVNVETVEEPLSIENWMTDDCCWKQQLNEEETLEIEGWMTNTELWTATTKSSPIIKEVQMGNQTHIFVKIKKAKEQPLSIEGWMTDDEAWSL